MSRLAISVLAWRPDQEAGVLPLLSEAGIHGLETAPARVAGGVTGAADCRRDWQARGLRLCAMQALLYGAPPCALFGDEAGRRQLLANLEQACRLARALGIPTLVFGSGGQRRRGRLPFETAFAQATAFFRLAAGTAARYGTTLCLEAIPPQHGADFIISTAEAARLVAAVNHPAFALHLDTATLHLAGEDPLPLLQRHGSAIRHCHISEPDMQAIGSRGVDHPRIADALQRAGYRHWLSVEMFASDNPAAQLPAALAEARRCYGALAAG